MIRTSPTIASISKAILAAQKKMGSAQKGAANPYFKSKYADLPAVIEVAKDPLNEADVTVMQPVTSRDGKSFVTTRLTHISGEFVEADTEIVVAKQNDPQAFGSAITYARRYGLQSFLTIPAEDDDGEKAMGRDGKAGSARSAPATSSKGSATPVLDTILARPAPENPLEEKPKTSSFRRPGTVSAGTTPVALAPAADAEPSFI